MDVLEKRESLAPGKNRTRIPRLSIQEPGRRSDFTPWLVELHKHVRERTVSNESCNRERNTQVMLSAFFV